MIKLNTLEDCIDILGERGSLYKDISAYASIPMSRWDYDFINSLLKKSYGTPYTTKQAAIAIKLVTQTYSNDLRKLGYSFPGADDMKYRANPITSTSHNSKDICIDNGEILIRFPYSRPLIDALKEQAPSALGKFEYNSTTKSWSLAKTTFNINFAVQFGLLNKFNVEQSLLDAMSKILDAEKAEPPLVLKMNEDKSGYFITHAPSSLNDYIESIGGFGLDNKLRLLDYASVLGYTVSQDINNRPFETSTLNNLLTKREITLSWGNESINNICEYAKLTNRFPIVVWGVITNIETWLNHFDKEHILMGKEDISNHHKVIFTQNPISLNIPLLINLNNSLVARRYYDMMDFGNYMFQQSEKIISIK